MGLQVSQISKALRVMKLFHIFDHKAFSATVNGTLHDFIHINKRKFTRSIIYTTNSSLYHYWLIKSSGNAILSNSIKGAAVFTDRTCLGSTLKPLVLNGFQKNSFSDKSQKKINNTELQLYFKKIEKTMLNMKSDLELHDFIEKSIFEPFKKELSEGKINERLSKPAILHLYPQLLQKAMEIFRSNFLDYVSVATIFERIKELGPESFVLGCSSDVYNEMLIARWEGWNDIIEIENLLTEMKINSVSRTKKTLEIFKKIRSDIETMRFQKHLLNDALLSDDNMAYRQRLDAIYDKISKEDFRKEEEMLLRRIISIRSFSLNSFVQNRVNTNNMLKLATTRFYSQARLSKEEIESRIIDIVKGFDKITDPSKITPTSSFSADLGLDSLDTVEVVMAIEEAFNIEIPDKEADEIKTIGEAITYISNHPDAC
ncbi:hypothetical protein MERGE_001757 [Pneumocystis wakefieldiae]|uniref:Acyl carrier protein n=1 Tax=Pneumocystis wakefieldiae TaxID=38082 RepID=A0A899FVR8_9ASCO|nr:hypothetical protein MERGE_001757 [Pneumocystis wakefieldiae]